MQAFKDSLFSFPASGNTEIKNFSPALSKLYKDYLSSGQTVSDRHLKSIDCISDPSIKAEAYHVFVTEVEVVIKAADERGFFYAFQDLINKSDRQRFLLGEFYSESACSFRGMKLMLPGKENIADFKAFIDILASFKYNTIMLEIGGAMEYKRHPEINAGWVEYCREMNEYSGKTHIIQNSFAWQKDSIHIENGNGGFLTQEDVSGLVAYCEERLFTVIPEVPSLSHADYMLIRHPELAERVEDPYPDTYCPSNPESYKLLFELLDEIIQVFQPEIINIGHDEFYSIGLCEKCRVKSAADIYSDDINEIYSYLKKRNIKTMIWSEKFINASFIDGEKCGGAAHHGVPATYEAIKKVPQDLIMLHWYWSINRAYDSIFSDAGFDYILGNFKGSSIVDWETRIMAPGFSGFIISNWGASDLVTLQRNGILFETAYTSALCWEKDFKRYDAAQAAKYIFNVLFARFRKKHTEPKENILHLKHSSSIDMPYVNFVDGKFIDYDEYYLGDYIIRSRTGKECVFPLFYGLQIGSPFVSWERQDFPRRDCQKYDDKLLEAAYSTLPQQDNRITSYITEYEIPFPVSEIESIKFLNKKDDVKLEYSLIPEEDLIN